MKKWQKVKIKDITDKIVDNRGKTPKNNAECGIPLLEVNALSETKKTPTYEVVRKYVDSETYNNAFRSGHPQKGDILIPTVGTIGNVCIADNRQCCIAQNVIGLRTNKDLCGPEYLYYTLKDKTTQRRLLNLDIGGVQPSIKVPHLLNLEILLPDIFTQQRIARILSSFDDKIELNAQINHNLEEQAKAILDQNCLAHKTLKVGDIVSFANGFAFKSSTYIEKGKFKVVTIKNVQDGKIDTSSADCVYEIPAKMKAECILNIGDVLLSLTGNVGRTGIVCENNLLLNQRVAKIIPHQSVLNAVCYFIFRRPEMKAALETIARGTAQANLSPVETLDIEIPFNIPILQDIALCMKSFFEQIISNEMEIQKLAQLRDALLPKLMSGEIDVSEVEV